MRDVGGLVGRWLVVRSVPRPVDVIGFGRRCGCKHGCTLSLDGPGVNETSPAASRLVVVCAER